jgi:hypothetical protein
MSKAWMRPRSSSVAAVADCGLDFDLSALPMYVADPISSIETRSLPTLASCFPRNFAFYVADPISSILGL